MSTHPLTCLNGQFVPAADARIQVADRGFRFGDGVFETIRVASGVPYQWELHMARLAAGLDALRISAPSTDWKADVKKLIASAPARDGFLRIAVSRGVGSAGYLPTADATPTTAIEWMPMSPAPTAPAKLWQSTLTRPPLSALPTNHKLAQGVSSTLALLEARDNGCDEALMLSADGNLCEVAAANVFWVKDNTVYTPALSTGCLNGSTRATVMRLINVTEVVATPDALLDAHACFIANARVGAWAVATLSPAQKFFDAAHPLLLNISDKLDADRAEYIAKHAKEWA